MACLPDSNPLITRLFDKGHAGEEQENDLDTLNFKEQFPTYLTHLRLALLQRRFHVNPGQGLWSMARASLASQEFRSSPEPRRGFSWGQAGRTAVQIQLPAPSHPHT